MLNNHFKTIVCTVTEAKGVSTSEPIQALWSGYGEIVRVGLLGSKLESIILKYIIFPTQSNHPRGWNTDFSHKRKIKSYDVEMHWYRDWSEQCDDACRVAKCYAAKDMNDECVIVLEDLDASGFPDRFSSLDKIGAKLCLSWLANFHAQFMNIKPKGLWKIGTYWHLDTRPDEFAAMAEGRLKRATARIDETLNNCQYQTLVHGDAKVANFCFSSDFNKVAAVDFQYVGGGCGMKDVAYFLGSCLEEKQCQLWQNELLDYYFIELKKALDKVGKQLDWQALESEWRTMFPIAWTDFYRFLLGWMPAHYKINAYTKSLSIDVLDQLEKSNPE